MIFMNRCEGTTKFQSLLQALTSCDRRRSYVLSVATCYCTPSALRQFIDSIRAEVNLVAIHVYLDRRTALSIDHADLTNIRINCPEPLSIFAVRAGRLFHTKGYCLAAYSGDKLVHGRLALGSANMTTPGLTEANGNIESLAIHSDVGTISEFLRFFGDRDNLVALEELNDFSSDANTTNFQYALLKSGLFSHKWSDTLSSHFSVRYRLNEEGRHRAQQAIDTLGFQMDAASIAKVYFKFDLQVFQPQDKSLIKKFGVECFLGHWIPKIVVKNDEENNKYFDDFQTALSQGLESKLDDVCQSIVEDYSSLVRDGIIDKQDADPNVAFRKKINDLTKDSVQLYRIWSGRQFFELPYDVSDVKAIHQTFEDIMRTCRQRKRKNKSMKAVLEAERRWSLEPLRTLLSAE